MSLKIVFMGTPEFSLPALQALVKNKFNIARVYTQSPKKSKRGQKMNVSPVQVFSEKNKLNFRNPENLNDEEEYKIFKELSADLVVVVAYGKLIPKKFLSTTKFGFINIHASLLPRWRGAAPIQRAIMNGDKKIGVSIMKIEEKLDSGPVLSIKELDLDQKATFGEIEKKLSELGADLLIESLRNIENGNAKFSEQVNSKATYAKKISKKETKINWNFNADKVITHIHGLSPNPGAWFKYENERFKVLRVNKSSTSGIPGTVLDENLTVACKSGSIQISEIQREGKNKQITKDFLLGKKIGKNSILT
jgi:methionyl-tRNA formyltransferase